jgi:hypothetical protein
VTDDVEPGGRRHRLPQVHADVVAAMPVGAGIVAA